MSSPLTLGPAMVRFTDRTEGDMGHGATLLGVEGLDPAVAARRKAVCSLPWTWLRQVHGERIVYVSSPGELAGEAADAAVTTVAGAALAILTADCAPVALIADPAPRPVLGVVHAGWRGLLAGVLERTAEAMRALGGEKIQALVGPCIHADCYEFGADELAQLASRLGNSVVYETSWGHPALDVPAAVRAALGRVGVSEVTDLDVCTACSPVHFSHRRGQIKGCPEPERQAMVAWISPSG